MSKCSICGTEQMEIGNITMSIVGIESKPMTIPQYNIKILTWIKGKGICEDCMHIHRKIYALEQDINFSCNGNEYYSDGRNLA